VSQKWNSVNSHSSCKRGALDFSLDASDSVHVTFFTCQGLVYILPINQHDCLFAIRSIVSQAFDTSISGTPVGPKTTASGTSYGYHASEEDSGDLRYVSFCGVPTLGSHRLEIGAGISVQAGIPDFRSPEGLFQRLKQEHPAEALNSGKDLFDASVFRVSFNPWQCCILWQDSNGGPFYHNLLIPSYSRHRPLQCSVR
jgi:hypothetical protein